MHFLKSGKMLMVPGEEELTEPAACMSVMAEVVIESGSMSKLARFGLRPPCLCAQWAAYLMR